METSTALVVQRRPVNQMSDKITTNRAAEHQAEVVTASGFQTSLLEIES
jgi:hypothetical protein